MSDGCAARVLCVDDDPGVLSTLERTLARSGFEVQTAQDPLAALAILDESHPDLILLDVVMPGMTGYELCARIQSREDLALVPVIFVTVLGQGEEDRARAFAAGAADVVSKPFEVNEIVSTVREYVGTRRRWSSLRGGSEEPRAESAGDWTDPDRWPGFVAYLGEALNAENGLSEALESALPSQVYELAEALHLSPRAMARYVADFLGAPFLSGIDPDDVEAGVLPSAFCKANSIVPLKGSDEGPAAVLANPFDWEVVERVRRTVWRDAKPVLRVAEPDAIQAFFTYGEGGSEEDVRAEAERSVAAREDDTTVMDADSESEEGHGHGIMALANEVIRRAVADRASDIHLEPKRDHAVVRFRVDGDLEDVRRISGQQASMLIARFKALGRLDIAEKRKPQDGALQALVQGRRFKLRLATTATPLGESLIIRLLEPGAKAPSLRELGMTEDQAALLTEFLGRSHGLILVVGTTGSGKSTTIFSLLSGVDGKRRSIMTVEDPVEYSIPSANQQQVNIKAGATFEALLKSAVRQDPDVLLLGEIRDLFSAKASLDLASSGHLTVSTLHSSSATTAIFRLERLGVERGAMADSVLGIVAQKLLKKLCDHCKRVRPPTDEEREILARFTDDVPEQVAEAVGCPACRHTGYKGRKAVVEILHFDADVAEMVRGGASIAEIRRFAHERGDRQMADHAVQKVRDLVHPVADVYQHVLAEDLERGSSMDEPASSASASSAATPSPGTSGGQEASASGEGGVAPSPGHVSTGGEKSRGQEGARILVVEDDPDTRRLLERFLEVAGHEVVLAEDGADALIKLGSRGFDIVLSDINMPNLDGLKLLEIMTQKGLDTPVVFLSADTKDEAEVRGLELGAADYLQKPVKKKVLHVRIDRVLKRG